MMRSVKDQEDLIISASVSEKLKNKALDILDRELYEDPKHPELKEQDLYDCEHAIDEAAWEKDHNIELSFWRLDTIIRDQMINAIEEARSKLSKNSRNDKYKQLADKWTLSNPSYNYSDISDELYKRYTSSQDLKYFIEGMLKEVDADKIQEDGERLIELADYLKKFKENKNITEDIDPRTNDTDELWAYWFPHVGKHIVSKETMIKKLEACIDVVKRGGFVNTGFGLAFRNIQTIGHDGNPLVPTESEDKFFETMRRDN